MKYVSLSDLSDTIRKNIWKIPRDIDFVMGIPRSGMIAASIISSYLNVPLIDIESFLTGLEPYGGSRLDMFKRSHTPTHKALVVDDTVFNGTSMNIVKNKLSAHKEVEFVYMCVYLEGMASNAIDLYLDDLREYTNNFKNVVFYEWNIFQHYSTHTRSFLYDMDGVLCVNPPDERNEAEYLEYIKNAKPLFIPRSQLGGIVTYRLIKNKEITEKWLHDNGVSYGELIMFDANTWDERNRSGVTPEKFKSDFYKTHNNYSLFVESDNWQARRIWQMSNKPVFCVESNKLYQ